MSDKLSAEISVNVGEMPNSPGFKIAARLSIGTNNSATAKALFSERSGQNLEDAHLYLVVPAKDEEGAEDLRKLIQATIDKVTSEEGIENFPENLKELIAKNDQEEYEGNPKFTLSVSVHELNVVLRVRPIDGAREVISTSFETASAMATEALAKDQEIYFEFDTAKSIGELLHSENKILDLIEAVSLRLWIHLHPQLSTDLLELATNVGAPDPIIMALGSAGLYNSASLNINFRSGSELPEAVKEGLKKLSQKKLNTQDLHPEKIPQNIKRFFGHFANNGTGNIHAFVGIQTNVLHLDFHIPGLSKFISE